MFLIFLAVLKILSKGVSSYRLCILQKRLTHPRGPWSHRCGKLSLMICFSMQVPERLKMGSSNVKCPDRTRLKRESVNWA